MSALIGGRRKASRSRSSRPISKVSKKAGGSKRAALPFTDFDIAEGNYWRGRGATIDTIILHTTVGSLASAIARFGRSGTEVSAHWIVGLDGSIHRGVEEEFTAYHAGDWSENLRSIGIEHVDDGAYDDPRPDALYAASGALLAEIRARHPIARILDHRDVHATRCPDALDTARIRALSEGGQAMTLNAADKAYIDKRIRDVVMNEQIATFAVRNDLSKALGNKGALPKKVSGSRKPATKMKGTPPKGHPAH